MSACPPLCIILGAESSMRLESYMPGPHYLDVTLACSSLGQPSCQLVQQ